MRRYRKQQGMTLVISLVILVALTVIGLTSMQSTSTEISMAGNLRESGLTFNAAEAGLSAGEVFTRDENSKATFTAANAEDIGLYGPNDADPDYFDKTEWEARSSKATTSLPYIAEQPDFIIRYLGDRAQNQAALINIGGYGSGQPGKIVSNFRITSRGTGQTGNVRRYLQSYYGKEF